MESEPLLRNPDPFEDQSATEILCDVRLRRADMLAHFRKSLKEHLRGTYNVLRTWRQPPRVCLAGLLHSAYSPDSFEHRLFGISERSRMRDLIGKEAEHIVYLFCTVNRQELFNVLRQTPGGITVPLQLANRWGGQPLTVTPHDAGDLVVLYMANEAEQSCLSDGAPTRWIADVAELGRWAKNLAEVVPPVFDGCTAMISRENEERLLVAYDVALRNAAANPGEAIADLAAAAAGVASIPEPFVWLGFLSIIVDDATKATDFGARAELLLSAWGTPWDKRLTLKNWRTLTTVLNEAAAHRGESFSFARELVHAALSFSGNSPERLYTSLDAYSLSLSGTEMEKLRPSRDEIALRRSVLPSRFVEYVASSRDQELPKIYNYYPGITAKPWYDAKQFPLTRDLERAAPHIVAEFQKLDARLFRDEADGIPRQGCWTVLFLNDRGHRNNEICDLCPVTTSVIDAHTAVTSFLGGVSYFSCLEPGTRVAPHRGPTNMRLRCHLGIEIPNQCGLKVGGIEGTWKESRCIVFDDSFVHEVWNLGDSRRVVLIVDMWHPDLTEDEVDLLRWISA